MKKILFTLIVFLTFAEIGSTQNKKTLKFTDVVDNLNLNNKTELAVRAYWQEINGQEVKWSGKVVDVKPARDMAEVYLVIKDRSAYKGFNIILKTSYLDEVSKLNKGQNFVFTGTIINYKGKKGYPIIIYLMHSSM
jgi:hypothetical protein